MLNKIKHPNELSFSSSYFNEIFNIQILLNKNNCGFSIKLNDKSYKSLLNKNYNVKVVRNLYGCDQISKYFNIIIDPHETYASFNQFKEQGCPVSLLDKINEKYFIKYANTFTYSTNNYFNTTILNLENDNGSIFIFGTRILKKTRTNVILARTAGIIISK